MSVEERTGLPGLVAKLFQDARALAVAEVQLARVRLTARLTAAKSGAILLAAAVVVALLAAIGLVVGIVLALAPLVGPALAGLIVLLVGGAIAALLAWLGVRQITTKPETVAESVS